MVVVAGLFSTRGDVVELDFSDAKLPDGWSVAAGDWKVTEGELRGRGDGALEFEGPIDGDFTLTFTGMSAEKASFEVKLFDAATGKECYTYAFLGVYHSVLDGVKSCLLREDRFVSVNPRMWIFPGRKFTFEVRVARAQHQMFLDGELGPFFVDPAPIRPDKGVKLRILASTEGSGDEIRIDDVKLTFRRANP